MRTQSYLNEGQHLIDTFQDKCSACGGAAKCCHHIEPSKKEFNISSWKVIAGLSIDALRAELDKCTPLCYECHEDVHRRDYPGGMPVIHSLRNSILRDKIHSMLLPWQIGEPVELDDLDPIDLRRL